MANASVGSLMHAQLRSLEAASVGHAVRRSDRPALIGTSDQPDYLRLAL